MGCPCAARPVRAVLSAASTEGVYVRRRRRRRRRRSVGDLNPDFYTHPNPVRVSFLLSQTTERPFARVLSRVLRRRSRRSRRSRSGGGGQTGATDARTRSGHVAVVTSQAPDCAGGYEGSLGPE